jgi:hypothetical protein
VWAIEGLPEEDLSTLLSSIDAFSEEETQAPLDKETQEIDGRNI